MRGSVFLEQTLLIATIALGLVFSVTAFSQKLNMKMEMAAAALYDGGGTVSITDHSGGPGDEKDSTPPPAGTPRPAPPAPTIQDIKGNP